MQDWNDMTEADADTVERALNAAALYVREIAERTEAIVGRNRQCDALRDEAASYDRLRARLEQMPPLRAAREPAREPAMTAS